MTTTSFTELVGCDVPLQSAPMGGISTPELCVACSAAGAMAMTGFPSVPAPLAAAVLEAIVEQARGPVGVNILLPFLDLDQVRELSTRAALVDFYHGPVDAELVALAKAGGALTGWQVGDVDDARAAVAAGCDVVVVRGIEGGGRMHGSRPLRPLLDEVVAAVGVPVIAAGGVGTAAQVAELLDAGAAAVRIGTRLLATKESGAHPVYKQAVIRARADDTELTDAFAELWPDERRTARVVRSSIDAAAAIPPGEAAVTLTLPNGDRVELPPFAIPPPTPAAEGRVEAMPMYAGTAVDHVTGEEPAADVIRSLAP